MPRAVKEPLITCHDAAAATAGGTVVDVSGCSAVVIQVTGSFTATVVPKVSVNESDYVTVEAVNLNDSSRTSSITATGIYVVPVAGAALFKADMTWSAGTSITVKARGLYDGLAEALMPDVQASSAISAVTPGTAATSLGKAEDAAHTTGDVGVFSLAVRADTSAATGADGDYVAFLTDNLGGLRTARPPCGTATLSNVNDSASNVTLLAAAAGRKGVIAHNDSTSILYLKYGATATTTSYSYKIPAGEHWEMPEPVYLGVIDGIWSADASGAVRLTELT